MNALSAIGLSDVVMPLYQRLTHSVISEHFATLAAKTLGKWPPSQDDVIKWNLFPQYWPFVQGIHRSPENSPHKDSNPDFDVSLMLAHTSKQSNDRWFETTWRSCDVIIMNICVEKYWNGKSLPEASFGLRVLSLPASVCVSVCVSITCLSAR